MTSILAPLIIFVAMPVVGFGLLWAIQLIFARRQRSSIHPVQLLLSIVAWFFILSGLIIPMTASFVGLALNLFLAVVACMAVVQYRRMERRSLLWLLALSAERELPLPVAARAFAAERCDSVGRSAVRLAEVLEAGIPLPDALEMSRNRMPADAAIATRLDYEKGSLGGAMLDAARDGANRYRMWRPLFEKAMYFVMLFFVTFGVFSFLMVRVVPAFRKIFEDFDLELPLLTQAVISASSGFATAGFVWGPLLGLFVLCLPMMALYYIGWLRWEPGPVRWLTRPFHRATLLKSLARAVETGSPLNHALKLLGQWYPRRYIRQRLAIALDRVEGGEHWCDALVGVHLLRRSDAGVLRAAERVGNLPWALREMATRNLRRLESQANVLNNIVFPVLVLLYAIPIALVVVGLFLPLVSLIRALS